MKAWLLVLVGLICTVAALECDIELSIEADDALEVLIERVHVREDIDLTADYRFSRK